MSKSPVRVLIDTDPGLDDAVGILYALACQGFAVDAMTSVAGNIGIATTTQNIGRLLAAMGRDDIAYAAGAARPLHGAGRDEAAIHGSDGLGGVVLSAPQRAPEAQDATSFLADKLRAAPSGALTVLALGPLTNLAQLARDEPAAYARIGRIIAMGGTLNEPGNSGPFAEFNMACDPLAAQLVFAAPVPVTLVPLDVTRKLRASPADLDRLATSGTKAALLAADLIRTYFASHTDRQSRPLHDPCVMLMALSPELFETQTLRLSIDCDAHPGRLEKAPDGALIEVAMEIDPAAALEALWRGLGR